MNNSSKSVFRFYPLLFCIIASVALFLSCKERTTSKHTTTTDTVTNGTSLYADTATSSVKVFTQNGKVCIQQSNTSYEMVNAYDGKEKIPLLLKIKKTELCLADSVNDHPCHVPSDCACRAAGTCKNE